MEAANAYLEKQYLPLWNERFTVRPVHEGDAHRRLGKQHDLASILSHVEDRIIGEDHTIRYDGRLYKLSREQVGPGLKKQRVRVEDRLDGRLMVQWRGQALELKVCEAAPPAHPKTPARAKSGGGKKHKREGNNGVSVVLGRKIALRGNDPFYEGVATPTRLNFPLRSAFSPPWFRRDPTGRRYKTPMFSLLGSDSEAQFRLTKSGEMPRIA